MELRPDGRVKTLLLRTSADLIRYNSCIAELRYACDKLWRAKNGKDTAKER